MAKKDTISKLTEEFNAWNEIAARITKDGNANSAFHDSWSIKDTLAHLMAWQQVSIARLNAAKNSAAPVFPDWCNGRYPDAEEYKEEFNLRIYETHQSRNWSEIHLSWKKGFEEFLELAEEFSEDDIVDTQKYPWLNSYSLLDVLEGSLEHHVEHRSKLLDK